MVEIGKNDRRITITFPYDPSLIAKVKSSKGYRWHPKEECWSDPYAELGKNATVHSLSHSFAKHLLERMLI